MSESGAQPLYGSALLLAGVSIALWTLVHPWGSFMGAEVGQSGRWMASHTFHFLGGLLGAIGLLGLVSRASRGSGFARAAFLTAFVGTVVFAGTGLFTAFLWPTLAASAPEVVAPEGPFFSPPHPVVGISAVLFSLGYVLLSVALRRTGFMPALANVALIAGAVLLALPPAPFGPLPWVAFPAGGVLMGLGVGVMGSRLRGGVPIDAGATAPA